MARKRNQTKQELNPIDRQGGRALNNKLTIAIAVAIVAAGFSQVASAQGGGLVAVLDVAKVFRVNKNFDDQMKKIRDEAEMLKTQIQQQQTQIQEDAKKVLTYEVGSEERNRQETEIEQRQAKLRTQARQLEMQLLTREARIYHQTYEQMKQVVGSAAQKNGISLVLRFDSTPVNPENRAEVIKGVNRSVVYHDQLDLTSMVIQSMGPVTAEYTAALQQQQQGGQRR